MMDIGWLLWPVFCGGYWVVVVVCVLWWILGGCGLCFVVDIKWLWPAFCGRNWVVVACVLRWILSGCGLCSVVEIGWLWPVFWWILAMQNNRYWSTNNPYTEDKFKEIITCIVLAIYRQEL
jgi:hypothetical protein